ncbi:hypothetical protein LK994_08755 [Ferruginibacter lapsinanis]|uniref:hypothetical protein n=1 Tax=Ferruginibacter lapsinanis TaxID=563172 RepID=UPI001E5D5B1B|nr:hypothetical protein [Ferruginibacter lapsinanis]UEG48725.1 hypothetical protein LK994_08755 [Ferruginibacter lapsinanis]
MPEELQNEEQLHTHRPLFLSILCIIVFLGSIGGIIQNARGYFKSEEVVDYIKSGKSKTQLKNVLSFGSAKEAAINTPINIANLTVENYEKFSIGGILSSVLALVGGVLMWRLQKNGFYSVTLGTFFSIITHFLLFGDNVAAMGLSIVAALGGLFLVILLSFQLKNMD